MTHGEISTLEEFVGLALKHFDSCTPKELVRFGDDKGTQWAIIGDRGNELWWLLVLSGAGAPTCGNIAGPMNILRHPYETAAVLSYGVEYVATPDYAGDCEVGGGGKLISAAGAYVLTETEVLICCNYEGTPNKRIYYNLTAGKMQSEPGAMRAVFASWKLDWTVSKGSDPITLFKINATKAPAFFPNPIYWSSPSAS